MKKNILLVLFLAIILTSCKKIEVNNSNTTSTILEESNYYNVTFLNYDDTLLGSISVKEGDSADYNFDIPIKPDSDEFKYEFIGFDKDLTNIKSDISTHAEFKEIPKVDWSEITWF